MKNEKLYLHLRKLHKSQESDFRSSNLRKIIISCIQGGNILEIGCGTGHLALELSEQHSITAIDPSSEMVEFARELCHNTRNVDVRAMKGEEISKIKGRFDNVIAIDVLEHINEDLSILRNIKEELKDGGNLVLVAPSLKVLYGRRDKEMGHYRRYSKTELKQKLLDSGFKIKKMRYWNALGFFPYFFYERILHRRINENFRYTEKKGIKSLINKILYYWFRLVENHISFGFGLSLIAIAEKDKNG